MPRPPFAASAFTLTLAGVMCLSSCGSGDSGGGGTGGNADTTAPTVAITAPSANAAVSGGAVAITASAADDVGVVGVQFLLDGNPLGSEDASAPYATSWDSTAVANGTHVLTAVVRDAAGNRTTSTAVTVNVSNAASGNTITAASCAQAAVQAAIDSAADGDTVVVPAGACSWAAPVRPSDSKGVTLRCAATPGCTITASGGQAVLFDTLSGTNTRLYRVTGFNFRNTNANFLIWFDGNGTMTRIRVDHNSFDLAPDSTAVFFGDTQGIANWYGVIDHNSASSSGNFTFLQIIGATNPTPPPSQAGTANNLFVEDNTITVQTMSNAGRGCMDSWGNGAVVWRRNSTLNCLVTSHGVTHSGGPQNLELYDNTLRVDAGAVGQGVADGYRLFHHQGSGEFIAFGNRFTAFSGKTGSALEMTHYRSATPAAAGYDASLGRCDGTRAIDGNRAPAGTYFGYPCWRQPGRDFAGNLKPMYAWDNQWSDTGARIDMTVSNPWGQTAPSVQDHVKAERDYYNAVSAAPQSSPTSPFSGSAGMGFGTLANRPTNCTTNAAEAGGGVGYWATDTQTLYRCAAANSWVAHYRPYTYPHPLTQ